MPRPTSRPSAGEPAELLLMAGRALRRSWVSALAPWELSPHQSRALGAVCSGDAEPRLADIADQLRIAPRSATEVVDALEAKGLVRRAPSPHDRRAVVVQPTAEGLEVRSAVEQARTEAAEAYLAPLTPDERETLSVLLRRLTVDRADS
ncbi:MarR family winged helix-turn-helix transcriptional regulator [Georgenia yuyongxinii]|nr:MarR family winged helix-turn-helix transcriptional regulator [Georgenia yuyongxinii]